MPPVHNHEPEAPAPHWRDIQQVSSRKVRQPARRRRLGRRVLVAGGISAALFLVGGGVWLGARAVDAFLEARAEGGLPPHAVREVRFHTDGVLAKEWLGEVWPLEPMALAETPVADLRAALLQTGQVKSAEVTRIAPDGLYVQVAERFPLLRMVVLSPSGQRQLWLVAADGTVYQGQDYPLTLLRSLPVLVGATLRERGTGRYAPLEGIGAVDLLLSTVGAEAPDLARQITTVDVSEYDPSPHAVLPVITLKLANLVAVRVPAREVGTAVQRWQRIEAERALGNVPTFNRLDLTLAHPVLSVERLAAAPSGAGSRPPRTSPR